MTDQEREIKDFISHIRFCRKNGINPTITIDKSADHLILNALEEVEQYRAVGTVEECREARDRQQAAKPIVNQGMPRCVMCHHVVDGGTHYCWWCGQKLDWR